MPMMIGADTRDLCFEKQVKGDPAGSEAPRRLPSRPLKKRGPGAEINKQDEQSLKKRALIWLFFM
jgi:hypothetical protein